MKLVINGVEYDASAQPFIGDLRRLKKEFGFGWGTVAKRLQSIDEESDMLGMLDDDDFLEALVAWMWMARLRRGERDVTREDVEQTPVDGIEFRAEPGDGGEETAPTSAPTDSDRGDAAAAKPRKKPSTKTSKQPSTSG